MDVVDSEVSVNVSVEVSLLLSVDDAVDCDVEVNLPSEVGTPEICVLLISFVSEEVAESVLDMVDGSVLEVNSVCVEDGSDVDSKVYVLEG